MAQPKGHIDEWANVDSLELARHVLGFRTFPTSEQKADLENRFSQWWSSFIASKRGTAALKHFESARLPIRNRTRESTQHDLRSLWRLARACHGALTWSKQQDPGSRYRARISGARRQRAKLAYHARQLAKGFEGSPPGLQWALWSAELQAGVGDIRDKLRKEIRHLPIGVSEAERAATVKRLHLDEKRNVAKMWPEFFATLADELQKKLPEIDGGPWLHLFTIGNLHYRKPIEGHVPALETMLAFELTFHLRRWSLGQADHVWASGMPMPKGGKPHHGLAASFVNGALRLQPGLTGDQLANRLKRLPTGIGLRGWPNDDG